MVAMGGGKSLSDELPWLEPLLQTEFYGLCECKSTKQSTFYCRECMGSPFCEDCHNNPHKHEGHASFQVYKSSRRAGIRIGGIKHLLDVSDIQPNICNYSKLVYINRKRKQKDDEINRINNSNNRKVDKCEVCGYELQCSSSKFCSIQCKVDSEVDVKEETIKMEDVSDGPSTTTDQPTCQPEQPVLKVNSTSFRKRKRKGTPQRSPFF